MYNEKDTCTDNLLDLLLTFWETYIVTFFKDIMLLVGRLHIRMMLLAVGVSRPIQMIMPLVVGGQ